MFGSQFGRRHHNSPNLVNLVSGEEYSAEGQNSSSFHPDFTGSTSEGHDPSANNNNKEQAESSGLSHTVVKEGNEVIREFTNGRVYERNVTWKETVTPTKLTPGPVTNSNKGQSNPTQRPTFDKPSMDFRDFQWRNPDQQSFHKPQYGRNGQNDPKVSPEGQGNSQTSLISYSRRPPAGGYSNSSSYGGDAVPEETNFPSPDMTEGLSSSEGSGHGGGRSTSAPKTSPVGPYRPGGFVGGRGSKDDEAKSVMNKGSSSSFTSRWSNAEGPSSRISKGPSSIIPKGPSSRTPKGPSFRIPKGPSFSMSKGHSTSTPKGPSVYPDRRATKSEAGKKTSLRITQNRTWMMAKYYSHNKNKDIHSQYFQTGLYLHMKRKDPEVTLEDVKRWHQRYYMKILTDLRSILTSPFRGPGGRKSLGSPPVKFEDRKEEKRVDSKSQVSEITIQTRSVFIHPTPSPGSPSDAKILEDQLIELMTTHGHGPVKMHEYLPDSRRFLITFADRFNAKEATYSQNKPHHVGQYSIKISYAPPPSLFYAFQERYFDPTYGTFKIPMRDVPVDLKLLGKECDILESG